jgi:alpha-1,2-mannosyltransferase
MEIGQIVTAWFLPVLDCDETFNYWEPLHYLQYGNGLQVWEYSPQYGLRSYFFLILHFLVFYPLLLLPKVFVYRLSRVLLTIFSIFCQKFLVSSADLPEITKVLFSSTTGILLASHTLLPSTFSMNFIMLALGFFARFLKNKSNWSFLGFFFSCSFAMVVGWPFVAVIFLGFILPYLGKYPSSLLNPKGVRVLGC